MKSPEAADQPEEVSQAPVEKPEDVTGKEPEEGKSAEAADQPEEVSHAPVEQVEVKKVEELETEGAFMENHQMSDSNKNSSHSSPTPRIMPKFPCKMAKFNNNGKLKKIKNNPVIVNNIYEFLDYENKGYVLYVQSGQLFK